jgi:hypothetical protein
MTDYILSHSSLTIFFDKPSEVRGFGSEARNPEIHCSGLCRDVEHFH